MRRDSRSHWCVRSTSRCRIEAQATLLLTAGECDSARRLPLDCGRGSVDRRSLEWSGGSRSYGRSERLWAYSPQPGGFGPGGKSSRGNLVRSAEQQGTYHAGRGMRSLSSRLMTAPRGPDPVRPVGGVLGDVVRHKDRAIVSLLFPLLRREIEDPAPVLIRCCLDYWAAETANDPSGVKPPICGEPHSIRADSPTTPKRVRLALGPEEGLHVPSWRTCAPPRGWSCTSPPRRAKQPRRAPPRPSPVI